jgi:hypothetical protein
LLKGERASGEVAEEEKEEVFSQKKAGSDPPGVEKVSDEDRAQPQPEDCQEVFLVHRDGVAPDDGGEGGPF